MKARWLASGLLTLAACDTAPPPTRRPPEIPREAYVAPPVPEVTPSSAGSTAPEQAVPPPKASSTDRTKPSPPASPKKKKR